MTDLPSPISWAASQYWDGDDGQWSSFYLRVGKPEQLVRVLISTAGLATMVVTPEGCPPGRTGTKSDSTCEDSRGRLFNSSSSQTWKLSGNYMLGIEKNLGYPDEAAVYGLDSVAVGPSEDAGGQALESQTVAAFATNNFYLGMFGLNNQPVNLTDLGSPQDSYLTTLKSQNKIPSLSWSYAAGARYRSKGVFGSLVLGGCDRSQFIPNDVTFSLAPDISRDIVVSLRAVTITGLGSFSNILPSSPILVFVDSTLPFIYLPLEACQEVERILGLVWDPTWEMYFVNETLRQNLLDSNPSFTFQIADTNSGGSPINITLPYAGFDLEASFPFIPKNSSVTRYFPLRRAKNDTQYTLGRTFLQEAYLSVNYEHSNFSISQTKFEAGAASDIIALPAKGARPPIATHSKKPSRPTNTIIGIATSVGIAFMLLAAALSLWTWHRRRKARWSKHSSTIDTSEPPSVQAMTIPSTNEIGRRDTPEIFDAGRMLELLDATAPAGSGKVIHELSSPIAAVRRELRSYSRSSEKLRGRSRGRNCLKPIELPAKVAEKQYARAGLRMETMRGRNGSSASRMMLVPTSLDLDRSLPPTPISESPQVSPIMPRLKDYVRSVKSLEALVTRSERDTLSIIDCYI